MSSGGIVFGIVACVALLTLDARAGGDVGQQTQQQQMAPLPPEQLDPIVIQVDGGGSSIGEWAALFAGLASVLGALEVFRRRRRGHQP